MPQDHNLVLTDIDDWSKFGFNRVGHDVMDAIASNVPLNCYICDFKATTKDAYNEQLL